MDSPSLLTTEELGNDLTEDLCGRIKAELVPGERLLWAAKSRRPRLRSVTVGYAIAASVAAIFFAFGGVCIAADRDPQGSGPVILGTGSIAIGLFVLLGMISSLINKWDERGRIATKLYALTDQRAIIWTPSQSNKKAIEVHAIHRGKVGDVHRVEYPDGSGDVVFSGLKTRDPWEPVGFMGIPDVRHVEDLVRRTLVSPDALAS